MFKNIFDFFVRIYKHKISSKAIEALIDAGALDEFDYPRKMMKENIDILENYAYNYSLGIEDEPILKYEEDNYLERLEKEKEVLGIYLSKHPLSIYKEQIGHPTVPIYDYSKYINQKIISVLAIQRVKVINDKKGQQMCFVTFYDESSQVDGVIFASTYEQYRNIISRNSVYLVEGKVDMKTNLSLNVSRMKRLK